MAVDPSCGAVPPGQLADPLSCTSRRRAEVLCSRSRVVLTTNQLRALIADGESDRVELTVSTGNTNKFGEAICAFANDFPNHGQPGHLIVGVHDDGTVSGLAVTDDLLRRLGELRSNVNIEPENFPRQTDYRNPVVAEALATLGYVNAFGRGVIRAQEALRRNGNPEAEFTFETSHVLATIRRAP